MGIEGVLLAVSWLFSMVFFFMLGQIVTMKAMAKSKENMVSGVIEFLEGLKNEHFR